MSEQQEVRNLRDLSNNLKKTVENEARFWTTGVVKSVVQKPSGYIHFMLDDGGYSIECTIAEKIRTKMDFAIKTLMEVEVYGTWRMWEQRAQLQFQVEKVQLLLSPTSATVQERLTKQGLLPKTDKPLPAVINRLALITSKHSHALDDFYEYYNKAAKRADVHLIDVRLEGQLAASEIADAINRVNKNAEADVIVLIRGGGQRIDLDTFDDYLVAEAICRSSIPVVTGIGHQGDKTIADEVADLYFSTPTAVGIELANASASQSPAIPQIVNPVLPKKSSWQNIMLLAIGFMIALALLIFAISQLN